MPKSRELWDSVTLHSLQQCSSESSHKAELSAGSPILLQNHQADHFFAVQVGCSGRASSWHCPGCMACPLQTTCWRVSRPLSCHVANPCCQTHDFIM